MSGKFRRSLRKVLAADMAVLALLMLMAGAPLTGPATGAVTAERQPVFSWGGMHASFTFMLDEDPSFGSPRIEKIYGNSYVPDTPLDFGTYYWKVVPDGGLPSATGTVTIVSEVAVERQGGLLRNAGNTAILLEGKAEDAGIGAFTGFVLGTNQSVEIGRYENVTAVQV